MTLEEAITQLSDMGGGGECQSLMGCEGAVKVREESGIKVPVSKQEGKRTSLL